MFYYCDKLFKDKQFTLVHSGLLNEGSGVGCGNWATTEAPRFPGNPRIFLCFCGWLHLPCFNLDIFPFVFLLPPPFGVLNIELTASCMMHAKCMFYH